MSSSGTIVVFKGNKHLRIRKSHISGSNLGTVINEAEIDEDGLNNAFPAVTEFEAEQGVRDYQGLYIINTHPNVTAKGLVMFSQGTANSSTSMRFGIDPAGVGDGTTFGVAQEIANKETTPLNVDWKNGRSRTDPNALVIPPLPANKAILVWYERYIPFGTRPYENDNIRIIIDTNNIQGDYGIVEDEDTSTDVVVGDTDDNIDLDWLCKIIRGEFILDNLWFLGNCSSTDDASGWINNLIKHSLKNICKFSFGYLDVINFPKRNQIINGVDNRARFGYQTSNKRNVNVTIIDTSGFQKYIEPSTQYNRIAEYLENANRNSNIDFIIVQASTSPYASEPDNDSDPRIRIDTEFRKHYHPLFEKYGVHLCITAGFHNYQRQHVLGFNESTPDAPNTLLTAQSPNYIIASGEKALEGNGTLFVNVGTGGRRPIHNIPSVKSYTNFSYVHKGVGYLRLFTTQRKEDKPPILEGRFYDYYLETGENVVSRIKHLKDRFTIAYET